MATVSSLVRSSDGYDKFIDYESTYNDVEKEFLRTDLWEWKFTSWPNVVYFPGHDIINARLNAINVGADYSVNGFEKRMRGNYVVFQQTGQQTNGSLSLSFTDREDQSIMYMAQNWRNMIADPETKYSFRKADLVADGMLFILNTSRIPVRTLKFYNMTIIDATMDENGSAEDGADRSDIVINFKYEHCSRKWENI